MEDFELEKRAVYEKKSGLVQLSATHLLWTPDSAAHGADLRISFKAIARYQVSKRKPGGKVSTLNPCIRTVREA